MADQRRRATPTNFFGSAPRSEIQLRLATVIAAIVPTIIARIVASLPITMVRATDVMTVDPFMVMTRPMPRRPDHLPIVIPIRPTSIVRAIADLDANEAGVCGCWNERARQNHGCN